MQTEASENNNQKQDERNSYLDRVFSFKSFEADKKENFIVYMTKPEIKREYLEFILYLNMYFILSGVLTYKSHMMVRPV